MNKLPKGRFAAIIVFFSIFTVVIMGRYAYVMLIDPSELAENSQRQFINRRGKILDRNGIVLADELPRFSVSIYPPLDRNEERRKTRVNDLSAMLAPILGMDKDYVQNLISRNNRLFFIKDSIDRDTYRKILAARNFTNDKGEIINRLPGVVVEQALPYRTYPQKHLAKHIIGHVKKDYTGNTGVEYFFDKILGEKLDEEGTNIYLTIDINIQRILEKIAISYLHRYNAATVSFLAVDPRSGDILGSALHHRPGFVNSIFHPAFMFEPGSVHKIFTIAAAMDYGGITENTEFLCNGLYDKINPPISCTRPHNTVRAREIITLSCNAGAATAMENIDVDSFLRIMENFGFNRRTGAWFNEASTETTTDGKIMLETNGKLNKPGSRDFSIRTKPSVAFGQEISVSTLQILQAATVIANKGKLTPLKYIDRYESSDGKTIRESQNILNKPRMVISPLTAAKMLSYMHDTVTFGTGRLAELEGYSIGVKTGTAQISVAGRGYSPNDYMASCIAILPVENPSLILYMAIERPRGETYGSQIAAPAIREAAEEIISYAGIPKGEYSGGFITGDNVINHPGDIIISEIILPHLGAVVPSYIDLPKRTLTPLLNRNDIRVIIRGNGWVVRQSPPPGTPFTAGMTLELILE